MPKPRVMRLMERVAELRAQGTSWSAIAEAVHRPLTTIEAWLRQYRAVWERLLRDAEGRRFREAGAEALQFLRKLLRSKDEKVTRDVARTLATLLYRFPFEREPKETPLDAETLELLEVAKHMAAESRNWDAIAKEIEAEERAEMELRNAEQESGKQHCE
jgi:transposase